MTDDLSKQRTSGLHALDEKLLIPEPSEEQMERVPVHRTTWLRTVRRIRNCRQHGISLSNLSGTAIGISLTAAVKTLTELSKPQYGDARPWGVIALVAMLCAVILALSSRWVRNAENVNLEDIAIEMEEIAERYHSQDS
jgi:hypothetical protein